MKKILLSLFGIITLGLVNFGSCVNFSDFITYLDSDTVTVNGGTFHVVKEITSSSDYGTYCLKIKSFQGRSVGYIGMNNNLNNPNYNRMFEIWNDWSYPLYVCSYINVPYLVLYASSNTPFTVDYDLFKLNTLLDTQVPVMTSLECQNTYDLVPFSSYQLCQSDLQICQSDVNSLTGDLNQCQSDLLDCQNSSSSCESSGFSNIYIYSDNQYTPLNSASNIYVNLPSYVGYNHSYSNGGNDLDITVGYVIDTGYIENINNQQSYIPTTDDFSNVFGNIGTFGALLVVCLFVILVFYMIKKIFS